MRQLSILWNSLGKWLELDVLVAGKIFWPCPQTLNTGKAPLIPVVVPVVCRLYFEGVC